MASDDEHRPARRRRHDDDEDRDGRDDRSDHRERHRSHRGDDRRRSRERHERRRSRTPDAGRERRRRSRDRDGARDRDEDRDRHRRRRRSRDGDDDDSSRRKRHRDNVSDDEPRTTRRSPLRRGAPLPSQEASFAVTTGEEPEKPKEKPNLGNTGLLAAASNSVAQADGSSITLKYHEPPEARKPSPRDQWRLFIFKDGDIVDTVELSLRSCWLVGREVAVVDLPAEHPSISKQHAVLQFRYTERRNEFGDKIGKVKPYLIDLESANGTTLNDKKIGGSRYLELRDKDMIKFGDSAREYVLMLAPRD
jgi:smad nuclear-interacting protein 1